MAITAEQRRAICRIYLPGPDRRGTGFLIAPGYVLTAAHVVASAADSTAAYAAGDMELTFGNPGGLPARITGGKVKRFDSQMDWALVELPQGTQLAATPFRARPLPADYESPWETYGYSNERPVEGKEYFGSVRTLTPRRFQLHADQRAGSPAGLSGSPCLIDGEVVGIVLESGDLTTPETLYAICIGLVVEKGCVEVTLEPVDPPYVGEVELSIQGFVPLLWKTAVTLSLAKSPDDAKATIAKDRLPRKIAETMMGGVAPSLKAIRSLQSGFRRTPTATPSPPPDETVQIITYATRAWIDGRAVKRLWETLEEGSKLVVLNIHDPAVAQWYIHRAGCYKENAPGKFQYASPVDTPTIQRDVLLDEFEKTVAGLVGYPREQLPDYLAEIHSHESEPIVVWLTAVPSRQDLDYVRAQHEGYKKVRVIFVTGPQPPPILTTEYPDVEHITPEPLPERVARALKEHDDAERDLYRIFNPHAPGPP